MARLCSISGGLSGGTQSGSKLGSAKASMQRQQHTKRVLCAQSRALAASFWPRLVVSGHSTLARANLSNLQGQSEKSALDDPEVLASRDSMEDTVGNQAVDVMQSLAGQTSEVVQEIETKEAGSDKADSRDSLEVTASGRAATEMMNAFVGDASSEKQQEEQEGKTGVEAFKRQEQNELDGIEQQYYLNDKLDDDSKSGKSNLPETDKNSESSDTVTSYRSKEVIAGRDWRVWAEGGNRAVCPTADNESGSCEDQEYKKKQTFGWSESKCDDGSKLIDSGTFFADTKAEDVQGNSGSSVKVSTGIPPAVAERLGCLEELVMKKDNGRSAEDYSRRADLFEKSGEVFKAKKEEAES